VEVNMGFEEMYELHLEDRRVSQSWNQKNAGRKLRLWFLFPPLPLFEMEWKRGHYWPIVVPAHDDECGAIGGMFGRGNWSTRRKPAPVPHCPPQIPHDLTWAAMLGSQWLTAWAMVWPESLLSLCCILVSYLVYSSVLKMEAEPLLDANFMMLSCLAFSILRMEVLCSSEMSIDFQRIVLLYIPEDWILLHFARKFSCSSN
jgi:hypothetical protein